MRVSHDQDFGIKPVVPEPKLGSQDFGIKTTSPEPKPERHETRSTSTSTDTRSGKSTSSRSIALERLSAIRDTFSGRSTISEARHTAPETPVSTEPAPLQAMQVSGPINPGFFNDLRPRLASLIGPMATFVLEDAADMAGGTLHTLRAEQLEAFLRAVVAEVPPAKHAQLRELVRPLLKRYGLRPTKENG